MHPVRLEPTHLILTGVGTRTTYQATRGRRHSYIPRRKKNTDDRNKQQASFVACFRPIGILRVLSYARLLYPSLPNPTPNSFSVLTPWRNIHYMLRVV